MLQLLHLDVSNVDRGVADGMRVENGWRHGRCSGWRGLIVGALTREPDTLGALGASSVQTLALRSDVRSLFFFSNFGQVNFQPTTCIVV
jgi:hypothetical protein